MELTYGLERMAMFIQQCDNVYDLEWKTGITGDVFRKAEQEHSRYSFEVADIDLILDLFSLYERKPAIPGKRFGLPAYDYILKCSHAFNVLEARAASALQNEPGILRIRELAQCGECYLKQREAADFSLLKAGNTDNGGGK